jgi:hypothetical protein
MSVKEPEKLRPLPGIVPTFKAGFELTGKHLWLVLIPALLDTFYWLGPRLSPLGLMEQILKSPFLSQQAFPDLNEMMLAMVQQSNLFARLTVPMIGVPALMRLIPEKTPLSPPVVEVQSYGMWLLLVVGLSVLGVLLTAVYFNLVAQAIVEQTERVSTRQLVQRMVRTWGQLLAVGVALVICTLIIMMPVSLVSGIVVLFSPGLAYFSILMGAMLVMWLALFIGFTPHGLMLNGRSLSQALLESVRLVQFNFTPTVLLMLGILIITSAMDQLMLYADDGTWLTLSSIFGHAFISTALVATTFIYYRDRHPILIEINRLIKQQQSGELTQQ